MTARAAAPERTTVPNLDATEHAAKVGRFTRFTRFTRFAVPGLQARGTTGHGSGPSTMTRTPWEAVQRVGLSPAASSRCVPYEHEVCAGVRE